MARRTRDVQKSRVYAAEKAIWDHPRNTKFKSLDECDVYIHRVKTSKWFKRTFREMFYYTMHSGVGKRKATARAVRTWTTSENGCRRTFALDTRISLPVWARNKAVVLHELAHAICMAHHCIRSTPCHGREYCSIFLKLVRHEMGKECHDLLREGFVEQGVKYKPKRTMTPEQKARMVSRLKAYQKKGQAVAASEDNQ